jgi:uncharacterized membrane protein YgcG
MLEPVRPDAVSPDRALCLPTFSHLLIVNKTSLSLTLSLPSPAHPSPTPRPPLHIDTKQEWSVDEERRRALLHVRGLVHEPLDKGGEGVLSCQCQRGTSQGLGSRIGGGHVEEACTLARPSEWPSLQIPIAETDCGVKHLKMPHRKQWEGGREGGKGSKGGREGQRSRARGGERDSGGTNASGSCKGDSCWGMHIKQQKQNLKHKP